MRLREVSPRADRRPRRSARPSLEAMEGRALMTAGPVTFEAAFGSIGFQGYWTSAVTMNFAGYEPNAPGSIRTFYQINNGPLTPGNSVTISASGFYNVVYVSVDAYGNVGPVASKVIAVDDSGPAVTAVANPSTLWPPNHQNVNVTVTGHVGDNLSGSGPLVFYDVFDTDGQLHPAGFAPVDANGNYAFVVTLNSSRAGQDKDGRVYAITVVGADRSGNLGVANTYVVVPHDMGHAPGPVNQGGDDGQGDDNGPGKGKGKGH